MSYYYGRGLGRVTDRQLQTLNDLTEILSKARYADAQANAAVLFREGMTPERLRERLRKNPAALKTSHGFRRRTPTTLPRYKAGKFVRPQNVATDYRSLAIHYAKIARGFDRAIIKEKPKGALLKQWRYEAAHYRQLARRALERAKRHRGVYSRSTEGRSPDQLKKRHGSVRKDAAPHNVVNAEGLTFREWSNAANAFRSRPLGLSHARSEWRAGVDPTEYGRSRSPDRPRASRAQRGPADVAKKIALRQKKSHPAGRRMRGEELYKWREHWLRFHLEREGLSSHFERVRHLVRPTDDDLVRASHKSDHERYVRAYGRG